VCDAPIVEIGVDIFEASFALASAVFGCFNVAGKDARSVAHKLLGFLCLSFCELPRLGGFVDLLGTRLLLARHKNWLLRDWACSDPRRLAVKSVWASTTIPVTRRTAFGKLDAIIAARFSTFVAAAIAAKSIAASLVGVLVDVRGAVKSNAATSRATPGGATTRHVRRRIVPNRK
jgi:hypothetical protein